MLRVITTLPIAMIIQKAIMPATAVATSAFGCPHASFLFTMAIPIDPTGKRQSENKRANDDLQIVRIPRD
jgi:hypothetical protein